MSNQIEDLAENRCQSLIGPAGSGKTESIACALQNSDGRQLVLTHTHAGVRSLRKKFNKFKIPQSKYVLETIHGFFLKYAASYPTNSGINQFLQKNDLWDEIVPAFNNLLSTKLISQILQSSYKGVFVDEYQDCTLSQHNAILKMKEILPVRVLGDPLQGIFDFKKTDPIIEWDRDVKPNFPELKELQIPWRWVNKNKVLGDWLQELRIDLLSEKAINLLQGKDAFVWKQNNPKDYLQTTKITNSYISSISKEQSFVAIKQYPIEAHAFARKQSGRLQSMEEMACRDLFKLLSEFEKAHGADLVLSVYEFIKQCTIMKDYLSEVKQQLKRAKLPFDFDKISDPIIRGYVYSILHNHDYSSIADLIDFTCMHKGEDIFRKELMTEMSKSLKEYCNGEFDSIADAAWEVRTRTRVRGQDIPRKIVSRPHLIKGLEFDNALVLNADKIKNAKYFYVCLTRACYSMTILSESPIVHFKL